MDHGNARKLELLEVMRGFAALWVLLHHAQQSSRHFFNHSGGLSILESGYLGVDFFFLLSGFIILISSRKIIARGGGVYDYLRSRFLRIYVPYFPVGFSILVLYLVFPHISQGERSVGVLTSLTLLPSDAPPALSVAWTLVHEILFYTVFCIWFFSRVVFFTLASVWVLVILLFADSYSGRFVNYFLSPLNLYFIGGICLAVLRAKIQSSFVMDFAVGFVGVLFLVILSLNEHPNRLLFSVPLFAILFAMSSDNFIDCHPPKWLLFLGASSYAIYLVHNPVLAFASRLVVKISPSIAPWIGLVAISVVALIGGFIYRVLYEVPALAWFGGKIPKSSRMPRSPRKD